MIRIINDKVLTCYEDRLKDVENTCTLLKKKVTDMELELDSFRNKVLRKVQTPKQEPESEDNPKDLYSKVLIPVK